MDNNKLKAAIKAARRSDRMIARLASAGLTVKADSHRIRVFGDTYPVKDVIKAAGFRWDRGSKSWFYKLTSYKNFRVSCGRLEDCTIVRHASPSIDIRAELCRALAG